MITNILEYLEQSTIRFPDKVAFADEQNLFTYHQVQRAAKSIGTHILKSTKKKGAVVVLTSRSSKNLAAFFGVVYSGNFYAPIDMALPHYRIMSILQSLMPIAIIVDAQTRPTAITLDYDGLLIDFGEACHTTADEQILTVTRKRMISTDPLYAMFTSGSTGIPKGVLISHGSVIDLVEQFTRIFSFTENEVFGNQAPFDFDVSVKDIYSTLKNGATMYIVPKICFSFPKKLIDFLNTHKITTAIWATSALRIVANLKALENERPQYFKKVMFSGEVMPNKVLNYWRKHLPDALYVNLYGPTEITCNCSYYIVDRPYADVDVLPIGVPFPNTQIIVLNENNLPAQDGEIGEICVRGVSLALGYYNNHQKTAEAFGQSPLNPLYPDRIYHTGDLGYINDEGLLMFVSRKDSQIKHLGHRIELNEIEVVVNSLEFIDAACCLYDKGNEKILLFYQAAQKCDKRIYDGIKNMLPKYMLPNRLIHLEQLPINKNAKIDRKKLKLILSKKDTSVNAIRG